MLTEFIKNEFRLDFSTWIRSLSHMKDTDNRTAKHYGTIAPNRSVSQTKTKTLTTYFSSQKRSRAIRKRCFFMHSSNRPPLLCACADLTKFIRKSL